MRHDMVDRSEVMAAITKEYNRKHTNDGLKLAWIENAVNESAGCIHCDECANLIGRYGLMVCKEWQASTVPSGWGYRAEPKGSSI